MIKKVPIKGIYAAEVAGHFSNAWVFNFDLVYALKAVNGGCFTYKFVIDVCNLISIKNNFRTMYHIKINEQVQLYSSTNLAALRK